MAIVQQSNCLALSPFVADLLEDGVDSGYWTAVNTPSTTSEPETATVVDVLPSLVAGPDTWKGLQLRSGDQEQLQDLECEFWMDGDDLENVDLSLLDCHVTGPSGCSSYPVQLELREDIGRVSCVFRPLEFGQHTAFLFVRDRLQSSLPILVFRNYSRFQRRPAVSLDIQIDEATLLLCHRTPWGIACNLKTEQVAVCDRENHEVLVFSSEGEFQFRFGSFGFGAGEFNRPVALAWDCPGDRFLVVDKGNHRIQIFTSSGHFLSSFGTRGRLPGQFNFPWGIAVSDDEQLIAVADSRNARIQFFDSNGRFLRLLCGQLKNPRGVAFDHSGRSLFVSDFTRHAVFKVDVDAGTIILLVDDSIVGRPSGLDVDVCGNVLVCDFNNNCVRVFDPTTGILLHSILSIGHISFDRPLDITVMRAGYIAVLDANGRIRIF